jgi:serine/threonine-protein kinase
MIGSSVGSYRVLSPIGQGGMGAVYVAEHQLLGQKVAVKILLPQFSQDAEIVNRFFNEARATSQIKHPGIVQIFDFGHYSDSSAYIVMEYLEGESMAARLRRQGCQSLEVIIEITRQIANALAAAHAKGIVHRDLKPDNVFFVEDLDMPLGFRAKILDFGIAKLAGDGVAGGPKTRTGVVMGTPYYMSPEQCKGAGRVDQRADLYSLACMMFEMATGRSPFVYEGAGEIIAAHIFQAPPAMREVLATAPLELEPIVARGLAKKPEDRYASAAELVAALGTLSAARLSGRFPAPAPGSVSSPSLPADPRDASTRMAGPTTLGGAAAEVVPRSAPRSRPWLSVAVAGGLLAAVGGFFALRSSSSSSSPPAAPPPVVQAPTAVVEPPPPQPVKPPPKKLTARIESHPSAADVVRDGVLVGKTPFTLEHEAGPGELSFVVQAKGYDPAPVSLAGDHDAAQKVQLKHSHSGSSGGKDAKKHKNAVFDPFAE